MKFQKTLMAGALGSLLLFGATSYAAPQYRDDRGIERQERIARDEIRRGEAMEQQGRLLEQRGDWRRGERLERRGENLEQHGRNMLRYTEGRERYHEDWEYRR